MSEKKYTIDNAKNDIQNLQNQNSYDFQEIKRLDGIIKDYDKRILQTINFNDLRYRKIQYDYENLKKTVLDRIKHLEDNLSTPTVKTYSVTYYLNNVICSNNTTTLTENSSYSTSLTPYNDFTISNVTVSVGGVNVTDSVYSNGVINIANVTGNIIISASAIYLVICKNAGLSSVDGSETESRTRIATDYIPVSIQGQLSIYSKTTENYRYLVRYYDIDKKFMGIGGGEWVLDGSVTFFESINGIDFRQVKFLRLVYKSKYNDNEVINKISGTIEIEEDGNHKTLCMQYE